MPSPTVVADRHRPPLPSTPTLRRRGDLPLRLPWGWRPSSDEPGVWTGRVAFAGISLGGQKRAEVLTVATLRLPEDGPRGRLYVNRGFRAALGGATVAVDGPARRVETAGSGLERFVVHCDPALDDEVVRAVLSAEVVRALASADRDFGLEWVGRDLVVHAAGLRVAAGREQLTLAAVAARRSITSLGDGIRPDARTRTARP